MMVDIPDVETETLLPGLRVTAVHLRPPGDPGANFMAARLLRRIEGQVLDEQRTRRVALLIGASIVPFGLWLRRTLPETLTHSESSDTGAVAAPRPDYRGYRAVIVLGLLMFASGTVGSYTINYMTTYALTTLKAKTIVGAYPKKKLEAELEPSLSAA